MCRAKVRRHGVKHAASAGIPIGAGLLLAAAAAGLNRFVHGRGVRGGQDVIEADAYWDGIAVSQRPSTPRHQTSYDTA